MGELIPPWYQLPRQNYFFRRSGNTSVRRIVKFRLSLKTMAFSAMESPTAITPFFSGAFELWKRFPSKRADSAERQGADLAGSELPRGEFTVVTPYPKLFRASSAVPEPELPAILAERDHFRRLNAP